MTVPKQEGEGVLIRAQGQQATAEQGDVGVVQQTPTLILLKYGTGAVTRGAKPAEAFARLLEAALPQKAETSEEGQAPGAEDSRAQLPG